MIPKNLEIYIIHEGNYEQNNNIHYDTYTSLY